MKLLLSLKNNQFIIKDCKFFAVFFCDRLQKIQDVTISEVFVVFCYFSKTQDVV